MTDDLKLAGLHINCSQYTHTDDDTTRRGKIGSQNNQDYNPLQREWVRRRQRLEN